MKTQNEPKFKIASFKIVFLTSCLTIFVSAAESREIGYLSKSKTLRSPANTLQLGHGTPADKCSHLFASSNRNLMQVNQNKKLNSAKFTGKIPFGTGNGRIVTNAPIEFAIEGNIKLLGFVERQRDEDQGILIITDAKAERIIKKIEMKTETPSGLRVIPTLDGIRLAYFGSSLVAPVVGDQLFIVNLKTDKVKEIILPSGAKDGGTIFPKNAGDPILAYNGKKTFEAFETTHFKKMGKWKLEGLQKDKYETSALLDVPGRPDQMLLVSDKKLVQINTVQKSIERIVFGDLSHKNGVVQTDNGTIFYAVDFGGVNHSDRKFIHFFNLEMNSQHSVEIGDVNNNVVDVTPLTHNGITELVILMRIKDGTSAVGMMNPNSQNITWSTNVPGVVTQSKIINLKGQPPQILLIRPGHVENSSGQSGLVVPGENSGDRGSYGYIYSMQGILQLRVEFHEGLKTSPVIVDGTNDFQIKYQSVLTDELNTLTIR